VPHTFWQFGLLQQGTIEKRALTNALQALRQINALQLLKPRKHVIGDLGDTFFKQDLLHMLVPAHRAANSFAAAKDQMVREGVLVKNVRQHFDVRDRLETCETFIRQADQLLSYTLTAVVGDIPIYNGQIRVPVLSKNESVTIIATSNSPLPFALVNGGWEGFYTTRSQRV
jgi:hypothetical protein